MTRLNRPDQPTITASGMLAMAQLSRSTDYSSGEGYQLRVRPGIPPSPFWRRRRRSSIRAIIRARLVCPSWCFVPFAVLVPALERAAGPWPHTAAS